ncbi:MAG: hypothetical protein ACP5RT_02535 [Candidatus Micrarchaeia archaeon]
MENYRILEIPEYFELLLAVANGYNYASKIATYFGREGKIIGHNKKQPTITEQLHTLERYGIVKEKEYSKAKVYEVNWNPIINIFYNVVKTALNDIEYVFGKKDVRKIKMVGLEHIVPSEFIKDFFSLHVDSLTIGVIAIKHKGISELVLGFFAAISHLEKKDLNAIIKKYSIDKPVLLEVADFINHYLYISELQTLQSLIYTGSGFRKVVGLKKSGEKHEK